MATPSYPSDLPGVSGFSLAPTTQLSVTGQARSARGVHRFTRVRGAVATATWKFNTGQYQVFMDWWRDELLDGHRWFNAVLPGPTGLANVLARFLQHRETQTKGYRYWIVTGTLEILERKSQLSVVDTVFTTTMYPILNVEGIEGSAGVDSFRGFSIPIDAVDPSVSVDSFLLHVALLTSHMLPEAIDPSLLVDSFLLHTILLGSSMLPEALDPAVSVVSFDLQDGLVSYHHYPPEAIDPSVSVSSFDLT